MAARLWWGLRNYITFYQDNEYHKSSVFHPYLIISADSSLRELKSCIEPAPLYVTPIWPVFGAPLSSELDWYFHLQIMKLCVNKGEPTKKYIIRTRESIFFHKFYLTPVRLFSFLIPKGMALCLQYPLSIRYNIP